jgi:hypothetical protein
VTNLRAEQFFAIPAGEGDFSVQNRSNRLWGPCTLKFNSYWGSFAEVKRPGRDFDYSPLCSANVKNDLSCTSSPLHAIVCIKGRLKIGKKYHTCHHVIKPSGNAEYRFVCRLSSLRFCAVLLSPSTQIPGMPITSNRPRPLLTTSSPTVIIMHPIFRRCVIWTTDFVK